MGHAVQAYGGPRGGGENEDSSLGAGEPGEPGDPVTGSFLEVLFTFLQEDLQTVKKDLSTELWEMRKELNEVGERAAKLERKDDERSNKIESMQQEILHLQDQ
ncbi:hypothetical protein NDU88_006048 [Pleurodeles waltl]|uniref:Uncharacterized protein n=1 Tax=Pleurodeles waltl TaxID=8319 RepID=A0AAV7ULW1_PLEWA|nr:hypothetical protein NDU88_006048 [Pleurodeles waltl]